MRFGSGTLKPASYTWKTFGWSESACANTVIVVRGGPPRNCINASHPFTKGRPSRPRDKSKRKNPLCRGNCSQRRGRLREKVRDVFASAVARDVEGALLDFVAQARRHSQRVKDGGM